MRRRIMLLVSSMTVLVVLAFVVPLAILIRHAVYQNATNDLQDETNQIANYLRASYTMPTSSAIAAHLATLTDGRDASVQLANGTVIGKLPPGGLTGLAQLQDAPGGDGGSAGAGDGSGAGGGADFGSHPVQGNVMTWHGGKITQLQVLGGPSTQASVTVRVYASDDQLHSGEIGWWLLLGLGSLGLLLLGLVAAELLTRRLVRPLVQTAETAHRLGSGDVSARAPTRGPREIAEVGVALNRLADRIDELIAEERETVADMSHRLRTPLTALRLDAEALRDPVDAERIGSHASALERMLTAVIHAARRPQREGRMPACDATEVVGDRVRFWSALAEDQDRASTVELPAAPVAVRAAPEDLAAAVDALLENVIAHTPEGTDFAVRLEAVDGGAMLEISDDGPGLPDEEPVRGRSDRGSSGLGLDIARRCAEAGGGSMTITRGPSGGAVITLLLASP